MTRREQILALPVPTVEERIRQIEAEPLPANTAHCSTRPPPSARAPRLALLRGGETITYGELRKRVDRIARGLHARSA